MKRFKDEKIKIIVKTRGEEGSLAQLIETAVQEECELKSHKFKPNSWTMTPWYQRYVKQEIRFSSTTDQKRNKYSNSHYML
jgi:hypothetical protein